VTAPAVEPRRPVGRPSCCPPVVLDLVVRLRLTGTHLADIADLMNEAGIPTPGGGQRWWASHVYRLLGTRAAQLVMDEYSQRN
jgi:Recombinase